VAYGDSIADNEHLLKKTIRGVAEFTGRSRRKEVVYYWIATAIIGYTLDATWIILATYQSIVWLELLQLVFILPMFALFVRRLHDQNRSGWWGLMLPLAFVFSIPDRVKEARGEIEAMLVLKTSPTAIALDLLYITILVLFLWPGTAGPNQFGSDPRLQED
jgi:uncharacterized membrane protein YhaH (DUF805 family)